MTTYPLDPGLPPSSGSPSPSPFYQTIVAVTNINDLLNSDPLKAYFIDGQIDAGATQIEVPEGGLTLLGSGRKTSRIFSTEDNFTLFVTASGGSYAGEMLFSDLAIEVSGTNSQVHNCDNDGKGDAIEWERINFENCTSLGKLGNYRQIFGNTIGFIGGDDGLELEGLWGGITLTDTAPVLFNFPIGYTLLKAGTGFIMTGSFRTDLNALLVSPDFTIFDFDENNIILDSGILLDGVRTIAADATPNLPSSSNKAQYRNCVGVENTYVGGEFTVSAEVSQNLTSTLSLMGSGTTASNLVHMVASSDNQLERADNGQTKTYEINGSLTFSGGFGDTMEVQIRRRNADTSYDNVGPPFPAVFVSTFFGDRTLPIPVVVPNVTLDTGDRIEVWLSSGTGISNVTALNGGIIAIKEK